MDLKTLVVALLIGLNAATSIASMSQYAEINGVITSDLFDENQFSVKDQYGQILGLPKSALGKTSWKPGKKIKLKILRSQIVVIHTKASGQKIK